jgi:hypothetical protein
MLATGRWSLGPVGKAVDEGGKARCGVGDHSHDAVARKLGVPASLRWFEFSA